MVWGSGKIQSNLIIYIHLSEAFKEGEDESPTESAQELKGLMCGDSTSS